MEHQRVSVRVGEERHAADAGIERVARELHATLGQRRTRGLHVIDVQRDRVLIGVVWEAELLGHDHAERDGAGLELGVSAVRAVGGALQSERGPVELDRCIQVL